VYIILATPVQLPHRFTVRIFKRATANISSDLSKIVLKIFLKMSLKNFELISYCSAISSGASSPSMLSRPVLLGSTIAIAAFGRLFTDGRWGMKFWAVGLK